MRTIKFRGKRIDNGEWVEGNLFVPDKPIGGVYICPATTYANFYPDLDDKQEGITDDDMAKASKSGISLGHFIQVDPATIGQFTGLTDKNGKEIWEGDVLNIGAVDFGFYCVENGEPASYEVLHKECGYYLKRHDINVEWGTLERITELDYECQVVGNVHDNKELLTK